MSADPRVSRYFTYSDSALPAVAAAVFLALLARKWRRDWRPMVVAAACLVIVVIGFRRGVWIGAAAALAIVLLVAPGRRLLLVRLAFATVGLMAMLLVLPGMAADVHDRLVGAPAHVVVEPSAVSKAGQGEPAQGDPTGGGGGVAAPPQQISDYSPRLSSEVATNSTEGHMSDLRVGWRYVEKNFWTGVGPRADQLPGLVANRSKLVYVHNEWLMDWLRFGPLAPVLVTAFLGILAIMAIRTLRRPESGSDQLSAAMFGLLAPVVLMLFPLMTTSTRWPLFLGISAGILGLRKSGAGNAVVGLHRLNRPAHEGHQQTAL
jgi:O-antigen ligase